MLESPMILVTPSSLGIESLAQLLDLARGKPGTLMYASAGIGTPPHMFVEQLKAATRCRSIMCHSKARPAWCRR